MKQLVLLLWSQSNPSRRSPIVLFLPLLLVLIHTSAMAQPCAFTTTEGSPSCAFTYTPNVTGVDGYLLEHLWDFGDGSTSDVANPVHSYASTASGGITYTYTVTHTVRVKNPFTLVEIPGSPFVCTQTVAINTTPACELCPSLEELGAIFNYAVRGCDVYFKSNLGTGYSYFWNFGDGSSANTSSLNILHTYAGNGIYNVTLGAVNEYGTFRCARTIKTDCTRPSSEFTWSIPGNGCGCFGINVTPTEQSAGTTYGWWVDGELVATGLHPNLFPHGIDVCTLQQHGGNIQVSLVVQLNGESGPVVTKTINLNNVEPAIYIGNGGSITDLTSYESVLPGSSYCGSCKVKVCGLVNVNKDFNFCGAEVEFSPGDCGFDVASDKTLQLTGGANFHGCECIWRGIRMLPKSSIVVNEHSVISDAAYAIDVKDLDEITPVQLTLNHAIFQNNFIGVRVTGVVDFPSFSHNLFTTTNTLWPDCEHIISEPFSTVIGYAGMYFNHMGKTLELPDDDHQNIFRNLAVGIHTENGVFTINRTALFEQMNNCSAYTNQHGRTGIYFKDEQSFTANDNQFQNLVRGIWGETIKPTTVSITDNKMDTGTSALSVTQGIQLISNAGGRMEGQVSLNDILVNFNPGCMDITDAYGIAFRDNTNSVNNLDISNNSITFNCDIAMTHGILISAPTSVNTPQNFEVDVRENTLDGGMAANAIELELARRVTVRGNMIDLNSGINIIGIEVDHAESNLVCSNIITNKAQNTGIRVAQARYNTIDGNTMNATLIGALFSGDCGGTHIGCNTFIGPQIIGLQYTNTAITGPQYNTGNAWFGSFANNQKAYISLPQQFINLADNQYVVPEGPSPFNPGNTQSSNGIVWFDDTQFVGDPDCGEVASNCMNANRPALRNDSDKVPVTSVDLTFTIAPNPTSGACTLTLDQALEETGTVRVVSLTGAAIHTTVLAAGQSSVIISDLAPGIYFATVTAKGKVSAPRKIVVF